MQNVFHCDKNAVSINENWLRFLKQRACESPLRRSRLCLHRKAEDAVHEMIIVMCNDVLFRPHRHLVKTKVTAHYRRRPRRYTVQLCRNSRRNYSNGTDRLRAEFLLSLIRAAISCRSASQRFCSHVRDYNGPLSKAMPSLRRGRRQNPMTCARFWSIAPRRRALVVLNPPSRRRPRVELFHLANYKS